MINYPGNLAYILFNSSKHSLVQHTEPKYNSTLFGWFCIGLYAIVHGPGSTDGYQGHMIIVAFAHAPNSHVYMLFFCARRLLVIDSDRTKSKETDINSIVGINSHSS